MAEKLCVYCHKVTLEGFDEKEHKFYEKGSKTLHTRERCEAAKRGELNVPSSGQSSNQQQIADLIIKVDALTLAVNNLLSRLEGQGTLDIEQ